MKWIWTIMIAVTASCTKDIPEKEAETRSGEKQEGITITVDTATTEYVFDIKI